MKLVLDSMRSIIKKNLRSLILFELGYRIATFLIVTNLTSAAVRYSLKLRKFSYLTAENFIEFLANPVSVILLLSILVLILLLFLIEISAILSCLRHSYHGRKIYTSDMFIEGVRRTGHFLKHCRGSWLVCIILAAPFLSLYFLVREITYFGVLEYTATLIYKTIRPHWILYSIIGMVLLISFLFVFSLPYCLLEERKSLRGMKAGILLLKKQWKRIVPGFVMLHLWMLAFIAAVYLVVTTGMVLYAMSSRNGSAVISSVLLYSSWIDMGLGVFAGAVQLVASLAFVYTIYAHYHIQVRTEVGIGAIMKNRAWFRKIGRRRAAAFLTFILITGEIVFLVGMASQHSSAVNSLMATVAITAHRGGALMAPENTVSALSYTIECGADYAEIDIQETADGELILLHDNSLKRTAGVNKNVWEMTYAEIEQLDAGVSFHKKFRGEKIPTLDEVLKFCKGKLDLNIEIKYNGKNKGIVKKVVRAIEKNNFQNHCVITSMNYSFLTQVKKINPEIRTGYIMTMTYGSIAGVSAADFFSVKYTYIDREFVQEAHAFGKEVHAWTVNYRGDIKQMLDAGVDNIITDNPVLVRKVENQESDAQTGFFELMKYVLKI
ncbi:MAG: glycerophosphodiester phosphodiesterase family protein [Blautia sp.]